MTKPFTAEPAPRTPRLRPGCDIRSLPLTPRDAYLLSRIDGSCNETDLAAMTGVDHQAVRVGVDRLLELGAVEIDGGGARQPRSESNGREHSNGRDPGPRGARHPSQTQVKSLPYDPRELEEPAEIDIEHKRKVLELYAVFADRDYYTLLGVAANAEKKEIKRAYNMLAPAYHPDRFFGKKLGSFKTKMEAIFAQITYAYETLSSGERRAEYDAYLTWQKQTRSMEALLQNGAVPAPSRTPVPAAEPVRVQTPPAPAPLSTPPDSNPPRSPQSDRARRLAFARKLGGRGSMPPEARVSSGPPPALAPPPSPISHDAAARELKRRRDAAVDAQVRRHVQAAEAELKDNPAAAANAYLLALAVDPGNPEIAAAHQQASRRAAVALAAGYLRQADYEARSDHWKEAARSYTRAAAGMPTDASVLHKAAEALRKGGGDLHQAADFAQRAVALDPKHIDRRVTLVEVYLAAGQRLSARRELEAARELAPQDDRLMELTKRLR